MTVICPAGHESATDDYCDVCGAVVVPAGAPAPTPAAEGKGTSAGTGPACANCGAPHEQGDAFCEVCGLDFASGELPQPPPPPAALDPDTVAGPEAVPAEPEQPAETEQPAAAEEPSAEAPSAAPAAEAAPAPPPAPGEWFVVVEPDHDWFERNEAEGTTGAVPFPEDTSSWQLTLSGTEVLIGRRSEARTAQPDLEVEDPGVSRRHAVLRRQPDDSWVIVDEDSTNGTWVDGGADPIVAGEPTPLADGATIHIGAFTRLTVRRA